MLRLNARRLLIEAASVALWAVVVFVALWSIGAAWGVVRLGYCMVAGCP